ncbi:SusC/RagA family TonB-linked outer membrane protein [Flavobacterium reichenbachii]|uniref:TonB-dependent receptor n=1 Tax=Flavobacterium reichenbachii TaxID=362418 RepID=A0A085ZJW5_9FLAO|nr:TonB-dependent receptor [Flavobacterium reichenbachii]KFF04729.1 TonB-dependent receptor [Flavobacterium reichenbachii]OXB10368.1 SusC/RagA family TonB-linked outer membrane protein [Flavobacterium reichenbachii]
MKSKNCIKTTKLPFLMALLLSVFVMQSGFAQESKTVSGTIISADDNMGVPGATVIVQGSKASTVTDFDGKYKIEAKTGDVLVVSFVGFKTQKLTVGAQKVINITLAAETSELKEIVVIGYGTQKKKVNTAATSLVSGKDIQQVASLDVVNALQGQASGVNVTSSSGQPGSSMVVNIRGAGTAGKSDPLYVVDGVVVDNGIGYLDPSVIERVDVLKDAAASSIYGARAANGVILVTTKKGKDGKMNVAFNTYTGFQQVSKKLDLMNTQEYTTIMNEARVNSGYAPLYSPAQIAAFPNHDWQKDLFNEGALKQNHSLFITGGDKKSTIATGLSYYGQEGMIGGATSQSQYDRVTFTVNSTSEVIEGYLKIGENFTFSNVKSRGIADDGIYSNGIRSFLNAAPIDAAYDANGGFAPSVISADISNPVGSLYYNNFNESKNNRYVGNIFAELKILRDFTFRTSFGVDMSDSNYRSFRPVYSLSSSDNNTVSSVTQNATKSSGWIFENTLQYKKTLGGVHNIDVLVGTSAKKNTGDFMEGQGRNLIFDDFAHAYLDNAKDPTSNVVKGNRKDYAIQSYFGRLLYDYDNRYLFSATVRRDGSSEFGPNNKYAIFPSFSAGWNLDKEKFFKENKVLNTFKLRASWGQNGNDQFARRFAYVSTVNSADKTYHFGTGTETLLVGSSPDQLSNRNLKWETSEQLDLGFDAVLFTNFTLSFDYYDKKTKDWLVLASIPVYAGATAPYVNGGDVSNKGFEVSLGYRTRFGKDWNFGINANVSSNKNEVLRIANNEGIIHGDANLLFQGLDEMNRVEVGKPMGYFYGLKTDGIFQNAAEVAAGVQPNAQPGDVRFVDYNGDGKIDANDKTQIGNPNPDITYGLNIDLSYKAFDITINTYGSAGGQNVFGVHDYTRAYTNNTTDILNRWTGEGTSNTTPRVTYGTDPNGNYTKFSDLYVQNSDFFRIKNVAIGCDLTKLTDKLSFFSKFRIYVAGNNLFTFTKYQGMDPEIGFGNNATDSSGNVTQPWARGIDVGYYPQPRSYMMGLNVNF